MRGSSGHKVVNIRGSRSRKQQEITVKFGEKPWDPQGMVSDNPHDNWLRYQAQSVLGGDLPTLEEARELFEKVDLDTRLRRVESSSSESSWFKKLLARIN